MNTISQLDHFYDLHLNCATHYARVEDPKGMSRPHHHNDYEIYFLISGNRKYFISNTIYTLRPHQIVIFEPGVPHQVTVNLNAPYERHLIYVTPTLFAEILRENPSLKSIVSTQLFNLSEEHFEEALLFISKINKETACCDPYSADIIKNTLAELLLFLGRHNDTSHIVIDKGDLRIQNAIDYILENYTEPITLADCAKIACMSPTHFSKVFHKTTAIGFKEFLNKIRIDKACEWLEKTKKPISHIAQSVGFATESHFSFTFKNLLGVSPSAYLIKHSQI